MTVLCELAELFLMEHKNLVVVFFLNRLSLSIYFNFFPWLSLSLSLSQLFYSPQDCWESRGRGHRLLRPKPQTELPIQLPASEELLPAGQGSRD